MTVLPLPRSGIAEVGGKRTQHPVRRALNPNSRNLKEGRNPKTEQGIGRTVEKSALWTVAGSVLSGFGLRVSFGSRISNFGFRVKQTWTKEWRQRNSGRADFIPMSPFPCHALVNTPWCRPVIRDVRPRCALQMVAMIAFFGAETGASAKSLCGSKAGFPRVWVWRRCVR